jgi:hypothetical protein
VKETAKNALSFPNIFIVRKAAEKWKRLLKIVSGLFFLIL